LNSDCSGGRLKKYEHNLGKPHKCYSADINPHKPKNDMTTYKPSPAFVGASWVALGTGMIGYIIGLWRSDMQLNEKGYYFTTLMYGLFSVVSLQKAVRDRLENIPVTDVYHGLSWFSVILSIVLLTVGLWNAELLPSEKGFYAFAFLLAMFAAVAVQKNVRDTQQAEKNDPDNAGS
jgi:uncharacterized membrane protein YiaA